MPQEPTVQHGVMLINPNTGIAELKFTCPSHLPLYCALMFEFVVGSCLALRFFLRVLR